MMAGGIAAVSPNGVLGDPAGASAEHGAQVLETMAADIADLVLHGTADVRGMLRVRPRASA